MCLVSWELAQGLLRGWRFLKVEKACWESSWSRIELILEGKVSLHPALRADPLSASCLLPAAGSREISFRPA